MKHKQINVLLDKILLVTATAEGSTFAGSVFADNSAEKDLLILKDAYIAIKEGLIAYIGKNREDAVEAFAGVEFELYNGQNRLVWPAMANTHGHIPMTLMRNQTDDHNLHDWLFNVIFPMEAHLTEEHVYHGTMLGLSEMIRNGTGAAADMYYFSDAVAKAASQAGFRLNVCCDGKSQGQDGKSYVNDSELAAFRERWDDGPDGMIRAAMLVHSVYLYEPYLYEELAAAVKKHDMFVQVHISETEKEVDDCLKKYGVRPPEQLNRFGLLDGPVVAAHCVHLNDSDRRLLAEKNITVAHNPASNFKLGSGFADVAAMVEAGITVGLGTDGAASNNNLDIYQEMRLAGYLAKGLTGDASVLPAEKLIKMATINGMKGLGFNNVGCIEKGWQADLQIVNLDNPAIKPLGNPDAALVYSCNSSNVESLMVNGVWLMYKNELKTIDEERAISEALRYSNKLS